MKHLTDREILYLYFDKTFLDDDERSHHLIDCDACREKYKNFVDDMNSQEPFERLSKLDDVFYVKQKNSIMRNIRIHADKGNNQSHKMSWKVKYALSMLLFLLFGSVFFIGNAVKIPDTKTITQNNVISETVPDMIDSYYSWNLVPANNMSEFHTSSQIDDVLSPGSTKLGDLSVSDFDKSYDQFVEMITDEYQNYKKMTNNYNPYLSVNDFFKINEYEDYLDHNFSKIDNNFILKDKNYNEDYLDTFYKWEFEYN